MPNAIETVTDIQDKVFAGLETSQRAVLESVRSWAETTEMVFSKLPELLFSTPAKPNEVLENTFGFTQKVLTSQRDFATKVFEAALPATKAPSSAAQSAKATASRA